MICSMMALFLASCSDSIAPVYAGTGVQVIEAKKLSDLELEFDRYNYDLNKLQDGVPPLILQSFPDELASLSSSKKKKQFFFKSLLPLILLANEEIKRERLLLLDLKERIELEDEGLSESDYHLLLTLAKRYQVKMTRDDPRNTLDKLLLRIDIIPTELALAQAANESAYGTSRFSQLANNLFGEWTFTPGTGIVPEGRPDGEIYEVRRFNSLLDSVRSYQKNLNTHSAYKPFRLLRAEARSAEQKPKGEHLAKGLLRYSTRREAYIKDLQSLIKQNRLDRYATATLRKI
ncbi:MAG TPA: glucosaminidase domain-containing protein [Geopsychrobacteraceae bacterium]|nr:glucosaminidase domain-containing protein [Geopsychrobacteraceae bacterium]